MVTIRIGVVHFPIYTLVEIVNDFTPDCQNVIPDINDSVGISA